MLHLLAAVAVKTILEENITIPSWPLLPLFLFLSIYLLSFCVTSVNPSLAVHAPPYFSPCLSLPYYPMAN